MGQILRLHTLEKGKLSVLLPITTEFCEQAALAGQGRELIEPSVWLMGCTVSVQ